MKPGYYIQRNLPEIQFAGILLLLMMAYSFPNILQRGPEGFHIWRQTDGLCFARHYYDNGLTFSDPQIFHLLFKDHTTAKTVGEFPGVYYLVAVLWKCFGVHEFIFRLITLIITLGGLFSAHKLIRLLTLQSFWTSWIMALLFTSPAVVFYSVNFIPDIHAISFSLMACLFFYQFITTQKQWRWYMAMMLFTLAGLIKPTALIPFAVIGVLFVFDLFKKPSSENTSWFSSKIHAFIGFSLVIVANIGWILWVRNYNNLQGGWFTPHDVFLPWNYSSSQMDGFLSMFREFLVNQLFSRSTIFLLGVLLVLLFFNLKKMKKEMIIILLFTLTGSICYSLLFFKWDVHDYYSLVLIPLPLVILASGIYLLQKEMPSLVSSKSLKATAALFLVYNAWYCSSNIQMRVNPKSEKLYLQSPSKPEVDLFKYLHWTYEKNFAALKEIEPQLAAWGIAESDLVVSMPDDSFNATLYLMHRRGWTSFVDDVFTEEGMQERIDKGARYLVINDINAVVSMHLPGHFLENKIGEFRNVHVYRLY